jgi:Protein involved in formate dehydrogenase formation
MQVLDALAATYDPYPLRRERAAELIPRYPFAAELLRLYQALTVVQEAAFQKFPSPSRGGQGGGSLDIAAFAVQHVVPGIVDVTVEAGPPALRDGVVALYATADLEDVIRRWLDQQPLSPVETYLARAACGPVLEAIGESVDFPPPLAGEGQGGGSCPRCGGLPQLSYFALSGEALVSGPRYLVCARCSHNWVFSRMTCAACGEHETQRLPIYQEGEHFPHMRVDACEGCQRYLITIDLRKDPRAIPIVDELAGLPLDLYAQERGMTKITPNLLGN